MNEVTSFYMLLREVANPIQPSHRCIYSGTCVLWTPWDQQKCPDYQGDLIFQVI